MLVMENNAFKVYEESVIAEEQKDVKVKKNMNTNDDKPTLANGGPRNSEINVAASSSKNPFACCCCRKRENVKELKAAGTSADYEKHNKAIYNIHRKSFKLELQSFLNSAIYFIFVIIATFVITILLFLELMIDSRVFTDNPAEANGDVSQPEAKSISVAMHWFCFAILTLFFIEMILRIIVTRLALLLDFVALFDCVIIFVAFVANLCVSLIVGPDSPIDGISLIIVLRWIRVYSLVTNTVRDVKKISSIRLENFEGQLVAANDTISNLRRQVMDKDFEIRQLHAYLGDNTAVDDPQLRAILKKGKEGQKDEASADIDLEMAIALSKESFNKENGGGQMNSAFLVSDHVELPIQSSDENDYSVLVHATANKNKRNSELTATSSFIEKYFPSPQNGDLETASPGAIRKKNRFNQTILVENRDKNHSGDGPFQQPILDPIVSDNNKKEPITICIDPDILNCEEENTSKVNRDSEDNGHKLNTEETNLISKDTHAEQQESESSTRTCHDMSMSSDESGTGANLPPNPVAMLHNLKHSGSSLGSESGYQSEEANHKGSGKPKLTLLNDAASKINNAVNHTPIDGIIQLDSL